MKVWEVTYSSGSYDDFFIHSECLCASEDIAKREAAKVDKRNGIDNPFNVMEDGDKVFKKIEEKVYEKYDERELDNDLDLLYVFMHKIEPKYSIEDYKTYDSARYMEYSKAEIKEREILTE